MADLLTINLSLKFQPTAHEFLTLDKCVLSEYESNIYNQIVLV